MITRIVAQADGLSELGERAAEQVLGAPTSATLVTLGQMVMTFMQGLLP